MTTLYRKWRPQTFAELRGQERVVRTLQNSLASGRIGHAYLFCGPRGVGKTTTARLLAKALNCLHDDGASAQPDMASAVLPEPYKLGDAIPPEPDNSCWVCQAITSGTSYDIFEIDAASSGRVDDARDLRDKVGALGTGRYKFYILDEAHQMTKDAFDALLKTLEEPPPRVIFVLATTDAAKLPATVLSRCQRFDFRRISVADIRGSLADVCAAEGIEAEPAALEVLARAADGSSRDSLSLLDQAIAFCGSKITLDGARSMLGLASADTIERLAAALLDGDARAGLELINEAADAGVDPRGLNRELVEYLRSLLLLKVSSDTAATLDVAPESVPALRERAATLSGPVLVRQVKIFSEADYDFRSALQAQLPLELAFLQALEVAGEPAAPERASYSPPQVPRTPANAVREPPAAPYTTKPSGNAPATPSIPGAAGPGAGQTTAASGTAESGTAKAATPESVPAARPATASAPDQPPRPGPAPSPKTAAPAALETTMASGSTTEPRPTGGPGQQPAAAPTASQPAQPSAAPARGAPAPPLASAEPAPAATAAGPAAPATPAVSTPATSAQAGQASGSSKPAPADDEPAAESPASPEPPTAASSTASRPAEQEPAAAGALSQGTRAPEPNAARSAEPAGAPIARLTDGSSSAASALDELTAQWAAVRQAVRAQSKTVEALLNSCQPTSLDGGTLTLACDAEFHANTLQKPDNKKLVEEALSRVLGSPCYVRCVVRDKRPSATPARGGGPSETAKPDENDPLVRAALRMLNARVLENN